MSEGLMNFKKCDEFVAEFEKVIEKPVKSASKVQLPDRKSVV